MTVSLEMREVHDVSVDLLRRLEQQQVTVALGAAATALTLGRLMADRVIEPADEAVWIQHVMDFAQAYFVRGRMQ